MLSRLGARFGWKNVPRELIPRLQGVRRRMVLKNASLMADALDLFRIFADHGIQVLAVKGGGLRFGLLPQIPQRMKDIDVMVPEARYHECIQLAVDAGYQVPGHAMHSADIRKNGESLVDLHYRMFKDNAQKNENTELILSHAIHIQKNGLELLVPCPEDMFIHIAVNALENFAAGSSKGPLSWLADCIDLSEKYPLDTEMILRHAEAYEVSTQFAIAVHLMQRFLPKTFAPLYGKTAEVSDKSVKRLQQMMDFPRLKKAEMHALPIVKRMLYLTEMSRVDYIGIYHLNDTTWEVIRDIPDMMKKWTRCDHLYQVPYACIRIINKWRRQKKESRHVQIQ